MQLVTGLNEHSGGSFGGVLDMLSRSVEILASTSSLPDALAAIAALCTEQIADYCQIDLAADRTLGSASAMARAGALSNSAAALEIVESLVVGSQSFGTLRCWLASPQAATREVRQAIHIVALQLSIAVASRAGMLRERRIADRFQRALLPEQLPARGGIALSASYRPASAEAEVGGDWYDAFAMPDGRVALVVGDVAGHGLDAAVVMGEVRQAMRTATVAGQTPSAILEYVNDALHLRASSEMVTAVFAIYDPATSVLSFATAGHPPPILALSNGVVHQLPMGGIPLGCAPTLSCVTWTFTIPENALLVFYTDGLIENDRDIERGERELLGAVASLAKSPPQECAEALAAVIFSQTSNRDDAAILTLARHAGLPNPEYFFSATPVAAPLARAIVERALTTILLDPDRRFGALVAVGEAVANAIEHAYHGGESGLLRVAIEPGDGAVRITIEDYGQWRPFTPDDERRRGLALMSAFTDGVQIRSAQSATSVVLTVNYRSSTPSP